MNVMTLKVTWFHPKFHALPTILIPAALQSELSYVASVRRMFRHVDSNGNWQLYIEFFSYLAALGVLGQCASGLLPFKAEWAENNLDYLYEADPTLRDIQYKEPGNDYNEPAPAFVGGFHNLNYYLPWQLPWAWN